MVGGVFTVVDWRVGAGPSRQECRVGHLGPRAGKDGAGLVGHLGRQRVVPPDGPGVEADVETHGQQDVDGLASVRQSHGGLEQVDVAANKTKFECNGPLAKKCFFGTGPRSVREGLHQAFFEQNCKNSSPKMPERTQEFENSSPNLLQKLKVPELLFSKNL